jgi:hypothetical protein
MMDNLRLLYVAYIEDFPLIRLSFLVCGAGEVAIVAVQY